MAHHTISKQDRGQWVSSGSIEPLPLQPGTMETCAKCMPLHLFLGCLTQNIITSIDEILQVTGLLPFLDYALSHLLTAVDLQV
jgi:hypothetical protein